MSDMGGKKLYAFSLSRHSNVLILSSYLLWNRFLDIIGLFMYFLNPAIFLRGAYIYPHIEDAQGEARGKGKHRNTST